MRVTIDKSLVFDFGGNAIVAKWDESKTHKIFSDAFHIPCLCSQCPTHSCDKKHRNQDCQDQKSCQVRKRDGLKAVDLIVLQGDDLFLIEVKDFANPNPLAKSPDMSMDIVRHHFVASVARKFRDTFFEVFCGEFFLPSTESTEIGNICAFKRSGASINLVFHCERPTVPYQSGLFPNSKVMSISDLHQAVSVFLGSRLARRFRVVDIAEHSAHPNCFPWNVSRPNAATA